MSSWTPGFSAGLSTSLTTWVRSSTYFQIRLGHWRRTKWCSAAAASSALIILTRKMVRTPHGDIFQTNGLKTMVMSFTTVYPSCIKYLWYVALMLQRRELEGWVCWKLVLAESNYENNWQFYSCLLLLICPFIKQHLFWIVLAISKKMISLRWLFFF